MTIGSFFIIFFITASLSSNDSKPVFAKCVDLTKELKSSEDIALSLVGSVCDLFDIDNCNQIVANLVADLEPETFCKSMNEIWPVNSSAGQEKSYNSVEVLEPHQPSGPCETCASVVNYIIVTLKNPDLEEKVEQTLDYICSVIKEEMCMEAIHEFLTGFIDFVNQNNLSGETLCGWIFFDIFRTDCDFPPNF